MKEMKGILARYLGKNVKACRRGMAFMLAVVMTAVNILSGAGTAFAAETDGSMANVYYEIDPEDLKAAINALWGEDGNIIADGITLGTLKEDYSITSSLGDSVVLYPLNVGQPVDSDSIYDTDMQVYYRPGTGETSDGELSGKLDVLFVNNGTEALRFKLTIGAYKDSIVVMGLQIATATPSVGTATPSGPDPEPEATPSGANPPSGSSLGQAAVMEIELKDLGLAEDSQYKKDIESLLDSVTITDDKGNSVDGTLYVGKNYTIGLHFSEGGSQYGQFDTESGTLTYQIPNIFKIESRAGEGIYIEGDPDPIGTYSVDENGLLTIVLSDHGKEKIAGSYHFTLSFNLSGKVEAVPAGSDGKVHFDSAGQEFTFEVVNQPIIDVEKDGKYTENADKTGGTLEYTVKTTVEYGELHDTVVTDVLTPPQTQALKLNQASITEVKVKKADGTEATLSYPEDYVWEKKKANPDHPEDLAFEIKLKGEYDPLTVGEELYVTYNYGVQYVKGTTDVFWGNVLNEVTVTGHMPVPDPADPEKTIDSTVEENRSSNVEIYVMPSGHGVVCKAQDYDEYTKTLHYTLYTVVPKGEWMPLYIYDDMYVEYNGERWYIPEFKEKGLVKNLKVSAVNVPDWFEGWDDETNPPSDAQKIQDMNNLRENAKELTGYNVSDTSGYDPDGVDQYVYYLSGRTLFITFGYHGNNGEWNPWEWGEWNYDTDRLIITEYDLDMSGEEEITLDDINASKQLKLTPAQILLAGITNNVFLRFGSYRPGFSVFFNNAEKMNKTGKLDPNTNTIEYTVSLNTTDKTVQKYFNDIKDDVYNTSKRLGEEKGIKGGVWGSEHYKETMRAVFYDDLPEGWEYVEGSLYVTTRSKYGEELIWDNLTNLQMATGQQGVLDGDGNISLPLAGVWGKRTWGDMELFNNFGDDIMAQISFTYKLRATDQWLEEHAITPKSIPVVNHAEIRDRNGMHWSADETIQYIPARLTKQAEQVEDTNLLKFTLQVNPYAKNYDPDKDYLIVSDKSNGIEIQIGSIEVTDAAGDPLTAMGPIAEEAVLGSNEWGLLPSEEDGKFRLKVPDEMALTIKYNASVCEIGDAVHVSNEAVLEGQEDYGSGYDEYLAVNRIWANAGGDHYSLEVEKVDKADPDKKLEGAKFNYYVLEKPDSQLGTRYSKEEVQIGRNKYDAYLIGSDYSTDENGGFTLSKEVEPNSYFILEETEAPKGYTKLDAPVLFYYGFANEVDNAKYPGARVVSGGTLTLTNERARGDLEISKTIKVEGPANSFPFAERTLHFDVKAVESAVNEEEYNLSGAKLVDLNGEFELYKGAVEAGTIKFEHGSADVPLKVKANEGWQNSVTIKGLPTGTYVVKELQDDVNVANYVWTVENGFGSYEVKSNEITNVEVINNYTRDRGNLTVTKKVVAPDVAEEKLKDKEYTFTIKGPEGVKGNYSATYSATGEVTTVTFGEDGTASVTLKADQSISISGLPVGTYKVSEDRDGTKIDGYTLTVSGEQPATVAKDGSAAVAITNTYTQDVGSLTVTKKVDAPDVPAEKINGKTYTFTIKGPTGVRGSYTAIGAVTTVDFGENGTASVTLKAEESVTISGLPVGTYDVSEEQNGAKIAGYTLEVSGEKAVTVVKDGSAAVAITNTYTQDVGSLTVTKTVDAPTAAAEKLKDKTYAFTIKGPEGVRGSYTATGAVTTVIFGENGTASVTLKAEESVTISGLPVGEYEVKEDWDGAKIAGYTLEVSGESTGTVEKDGSATVDITNTYTQDVGSLTVTKTVEVKEAVTGAPDITGTVRDREFVFTIAGKDMTVSGTYNATKSGTAAEVTFTSGSAEVKLKDGESITINGLPTGEYTVTEDWDEAQIDNYTLTVTGGATAENPAVVPKDGEVKVEVANVYNYSQESGSLTVTKALAGDAGDAAAGKEFTFTVTGPSYPEGFTVKITGANSETLANLVPGTYTVTEDQEGARINGYTLAVTGDGSATVTAGGNAAITITNEYTQETGSLTITKALAGSAGDAAAGKEFTFTVTGPSYPEGYTVTITGANSETLTGLVPGTYTVTEDQEGARINGYTLTVAGEGEATVTAGATAAVTVTNTYTTPENPTEPENPPEPTNPGGNTPTPPPIENITDEPTPLSSFERLESIEDEDVPLAFMAPMTGDETPAGAAALFGLIALGMMGAFGILSLKKDEEDA